MKTMTDLLREALIAHIISLPRDTQAVIVGEAVRAVFGSDRLALPIVHALCDIPQDEAVKIISTVCNDTLTPESFSKLELKTF